MKEKTIMKILAISLFIFLFISSIFFIIYNRRYLKASSARATKLTFVPFGPKAS